MVLTWVSLVTKDVECFSVVYQLLDYFVLEGVSLNLLLILKNVLFAFLIINCKCSTCILDTSLLLDAYVEDILFFFFFLQFVAYLFIFLKVELLKFEMQFSIF